MNRESHPHAFSLLLSAICPCAQCSWCSYVSLQVKVARATDSGHTEEGEIALKENPTKNTFSKSFRFGHRVS
jgi:hypothetical protein